MTEVKITIPRANENEVVEIPEGNLGFQQEINRKFDKIDNILFGVITAVIVSLVAVIISVIGLFLDQMRFNNAAYKEYSEKIQTLDFMRKSNNELLEQNKKNQELILEKQVRIIDLLNKK